MRRNLLAKLFRFVIGFSADITLKNYPISDDIKIEEIDIEGVPAEWQIVPSAKEERVLLYFHGGGYIMGSPIKKLELGKKTRSIY